MNKLISYLCISLFGGIGLLSGQNLSLDDYIQIALENNPGLQASQTIHEADLSRIDQVNRLPDPQAGISVFALPVETRLGPQQVGLNVSQQLPWFGTLDTKGAVVQAEADVSWLDYQDRRLSLAFGVRRVYYRLYELEAAIRLTGENLDRLRVIAGLANIKFESGQVGLADVLQIDLEINEMDQKLALLKDNRIPLRQSFIELLNKPLDSLFSLPDTLASPVWQIELDSLQNRMVSLHPSLTRFDAQSRMFETKQEVARLEGLPSFNLGLGYVNVGQRQDAEIPQNGRDILQGMLGVRIPLYRPKYDARIREAELRQKISQDLKADQTNRLITQTEMTQRDLLDARRRLDLYRIQIRLALQTLEVLIEEYSVAGSDFEELLRIDRNILNYALQLERARVDENIAVAQLQYLLGQ